MTRWKTFLVLAFLLTLLLGGASSRPAFCFSGQQTSIPEPLAVQQTFPVLSIKVKSVFKVAAPVSEKPSLDVLLGAGEMFARAA